MDVSNQSNTPLRVAIIGAGFSGTALAANLSHASKRPLEIILLEKSGIFGAGPAYSTPYPFHLLNVRAQDMSVFEHDSMHFVNWLQQQPDEYKDATMPLAQQFAPRVCYGQYLQHLLTTLQIPSKYTHLRLAAAEVVDIYPHAQQAQLMLHDGRRTLVDKVVLALGNNPPVAFPFSVAADIHCITNPWDYCAVQAIPRTAPVLIVGTGLSMIDAVLTLHHHGHQGKITVLSRHGKLPLPHSNDLTTFNLTTQTLPTNLTALIKQLRALSIAQINNGGDWRAVISAFRHQLPNCWQQATHADRSRFVRHVLPYWNIHRHRVHTTIVATLERLQEQQQLQVLAGRVQAVGDGQAAIKLRHQSQVTTIPCQWLINCMGPAPRIHPEHQPLIGALLERGLVTLDSLRLGFQVNTAGAVLDGQGQPFSWLYAIGPSTKGEVWERGAVPEIRKQVACVGLKLLDNVNT